MKQFSELMTLADQACLQCRLWETFMKCISLCRDLMDHRATAGRALHRRGRDVISRQQHVAEVSNSVDRCKAEVHTADAFANHVAYRYGYVSRYSASPPAVRLITEMELDEAKASRKSVRAVLLDADAPCWRKRSDSPYRYRVLGNTAVTSLDTTPLAQERAVNDSKLMSIKMPVAKRPPVDHWQDVHFT